MKEKDMPAGDLAGLLKGLMDNGQALESGVVMRQLIDALPGGVVIYKIDRKIETVYYSAGVPKLSGHSPEEYELLVKDDVIGSTVFEADRPLMVKKVAEALPEGKEISVTYRIKHKDGCLIWLQMSASQICRRGDSRFYCAVFTRPSEETDMYQNVVKDSSVGVFIGEKETRRIIYVNDAYKQLMSIPNESGLTGRVIDELLPCEKRLLSQEELRSIPSDGYVNFHRPGPGGQYISISACSLKWNGIESFVCYLIDESEIQRNRATLKAALKSARGLVKNVGIVVDTARNGSEGVDMLSVSPEKHYSAVLMDIRMPVMDGWHASKAIRALGRPDAGIVPVIAMTANAFDEDVKSSKEAGMNSHLAKHINPRLLYRTLAEYIEEARRKRS